ncbi:hypothetical protein BTUL_0055g00580 [Botrytis tulipae]|uniref:Uncharacterized protein n=1 Tax=Botrytis tulipae TaxID=87230 RepID=A0A4Z1ETA0_9HELO|nr:hypothetical protein BTUL_0055g00580 [Botrytis tulipae]
MHTQTLYTYALVALASSVLAAPVGTSASASISKNLVAREPFVVYGKSFEEEDGGAAFGTEMVTERRVDGFALPVSKTTVISRGNEGASGSPPGDHQPGPPSNGSGNSGLNGNGSLGPSNGQGNNGPSGSNGPSSGSSSGVLNTPSNGGPSGGSGGNQY